MPKSSVPRFISIIAVSFLFILAFVQESSPCTYAQEASPQQERFFATENPDLVVLYDAQSAGRIAQGLLSVSSGILSKLEHDFGTKQEGKIRVILFSSSFQYQSLPRFKHEPEWAAGEAFPEEKTMVIILDRLGRYPDIDTISVFTHELSHILLYHALKESALFPPRWFDEGVAMLEARKWGVRDHFELVSSLITGTYIPLDSLRGRFPASRYDAEQAYVESFSFITYLAEKYGERSIFDLITEMKNGRDFDAAFMKVYGNYLNNVEKEWVRSITMWYRWVPVATSSITLWIAITLLFIIGYLRKKGRERRIIKRWEEEDPFIH